MKRTTLATCALTLGLPLAAKAADVAPEAVLSTYADIAAATFGDAASGAERLQAAVETLVSDPSPEALQAARAAWLQARVPYQQSEVFRFGNPIVDEWEGQVNSWPLDEGLIDYVAEGRGGPTDENPLGGANVIASPRLEIGGQTVDAGTITPAFLAETLQEAEGVETNVATGWHAIEFLLWGQDLNGTGPGAGNRPWTDYATGEDCTHGNCDRRGAYLSAATDLLVDDLEEMAGAWGPDGAARAALMQDDRAGLAAILTGMGSLSYGELAGERIRLGLMLNDPEEEHDCFSDNTHNSHYYDGIGIRNVYVGRYTGSDGRVIEGPSLSAMVAAADPALDTELRARLDASVDALGRIKRTAEAGMAYDQMLARGNAQGEALIMGAVDGLVAQTAAIERVVATLDLNGVAVEGSDSLDDPGAVMR